MEQQQNVEGWSWRGNEKKDDKDFVMARSGSYTSSVPSPSPPDILRSHSRIETAATIVLVGLFCFSRLGRVQADQELLAGLCRPEHLPYIARQVVDSAAREPISGQLLATARQRRSAGQTWLRRCRCGNNSSANLTCQQHP